MTAPVVDWGPLMDDWSPEPATEPEADPDLAWLYAMRIIVRDRMTRMQRARELVRRAHAAFVQARAEMFEAATMLETDAHEYGRRMTESAE